MNDMMPPLRSRMALQGAVASAHPLASQAGLSVLQSGGNAFDAAVATAAALTVVEPFMSGMAGMGSATLWDAKARCVRVLDFVPQLPGSYDPACYNHREDAARGPLSVGLPAALEGWHQLNTRLGRKPFAEVLQPAIRLAEAGFPVAEFGVQEMAENAAALAARNDIGAGWAETFRDAGGVQLGQVLRQPDLAASLRQIARDGIGVFYNGALADRIVETVAGLGGRLDHRDLSMVAAQWREPLAVDYQGCRVHVPPPPCEGFQFLLTLKLLEQAGLESVPFGGADHFDLVARAVRLAAGLRLKHNRPDADRVAALFAPEAIAALAREMAEGKGLIGQTEHWDAASFASDDPAHTTSFSVADAEGNLICITQSLGSVFGSGITVPGTGITLNNFLYWADAQEGSPNRAAAGGSLPMCMSPSIATQDGRPILALGTPGGYGILQSQPQVYASYLGRGMTLEAAIRAPRVRVWDGRSIQIETRGDAAGTLLGALQAMGHDAKGFEGGWSAKVGGMQAIAIHPETGVATAAADPRRDGAVALW